MNKKRYCWTWGVGAWGLTTAVAFAFVMSGSNDMGFLRWLGLSLVFFPAGGYLWGRIMWHWFGSKGGERQPNKPMQSDRHSAGR